MRPGPGPNFGVLGCGVHIGEDGIPRRTRAWQAGEQIVYGAVGTGRGDYRVINITGEAEELVTGCARPGPAGTRRAQAHHGIFEIKPPPRQDVGGEELVQGQCQPSGTGRASFSPG